MSIRVSNIRLGLDESEQSLPEHIAPVLGLKKGDLVSWRILRKSLDARRKDDLHFVYAVEVHFSDEHLLKKHGQPGFSRNAKIEFYDEPPFVMPNPGVEHLAERPVVIGSGPGGLAAAYFLAEQGYCPLVVERGRAVRERIQDVRAFDHGGPFNPESNYLFGEGGAGTFSDGKLTCRGSGPDVKRILKLFADCKGKPSVLYDYRPHLGSNRLPAVVKAIRQQIEKMGGEIRFSCRVEDLDFRDGCLQGLVTSSGYLPAKAAVLAVGHSARDTYEMLVRRKVPLVQKPFQMGVRIEQPQENVNRFQYGKSNLEEKLGAADYSLVARGPHDLFTFCMCAGGNIIPSISQSGYFCTNGMSLSNRDSPFANSGLVVTIPLIEFPGPHPLAGVRLQEIFERKAYELGGEEYSCPIQKADDFLAKRSTDRAPACSYPRKMIAASLEALIPKVISEALHHGLPILDRRWRGKFLEGAVLVGPEARGSSPVRIPRDLLTRETDGFRGLYPVGEGAGYAGGIVSAAVDGLKTAKALVAKFAPLVRK